MTTWLLTINAQLIHILLTGVTLLLTIGAYGYVLYTRAYFSKEIPSKSALLTVQRGLSELEGIQSDLEDRFSRFQKRQGMRAARSDKEKAEAMRQEAAQILATQAAPDAPQGKLALYKSIGSIQ